MFLVADAEEIVKRVKDYACLYCASKSLPFSAAEMAMDCVSAAISSMFPEAASEKTIINKLIAE